MGDQINVRSSSQHLVVTPSTKSVAVVMTGPMGPGVGGGPGTGVPTFSEIVLKAGDTMTGFLVLSGDPEADFHAATKRWVEEYVAENAPDVPTGPDNQGFTFFQSSTPTATRIGDTWFDTSTGSSKTWDGFVWFPYALYPGGGTMSGLLIATRNSTAGYVDGTGSLQVGSSGASNLGFDHDRIVARNGSAASPMNLYASEYILNGGPVHIVTAPDASDSDSSGALRIGAAGGSNIGIDGNEIAARNNNVSANLYLQLEGGAVTTGGELTGRGKIIAEGGGEAFKVEAVGNNRPYMAIYGGTSTTRAMYIGYPQTTDNAVSVYADKGPLMLRSTNSVRSDTIYGSTANDWGVFIEANGTLGRTASTLRVKTNVEELTVEEAKSILDLVTWIRFNYIDQETGEAKEVQHFGAVAEWMHEAGLGEYVGYDDEGLPNAVRYNALWPLVARVQQNDQERLTALEETVADLVRRIDA